MDGGANISFPFNDSSVETSFLLSDNLVLDQLLNSSGGRVLNMVATEGPDGRMTLVTHSEVGDGEDDDVQDAEVEVMENELKVIKKSMDEIQTEVDTNLAKIASPTKEDEMEVVTEAESGQNDEICIFSPVKLDRSRTTSAVISDMVEDSLDNLEKGIEESTEESRGDLVDYFEMRLKEFESEIVQQGSGEEKEVEVAKADATNIATNVAISETVRDNNILNTEMKSVMTDNSEELKKDEGIIPEIDTENNTETVVEADNSSNDIETDTIKIRKKRKKDCPGTTWFGSSSRRQGKKRKVDEVQKAEEVNKMEKAEKVSSAVSDQGKISSPNRKRWSGRLQSNPTKSSSATPPPSSPPATPSAPSASSTPKQQFRCGRCSSILKSERRWKEHRAAVHGGKARLAKDPLGQDFTLAEEEQAFKKAFSFSKQVSCPRCNNVFFTLKSKLVNHLKKCKVEEASLKGTLPSSAEELTLDKISARSESKVKRKAATKAQGRVAEFVRQMKTKFEGESSEADADEDISEDSDDNYDVKNEAEVSALYKLVRNDAKR